MTYEKLVLAVGISVIALLDTAAAQRGFDFDIDIVFLSTFDDVTDANLFGGDNDAGWIYTSDSTKRLNVQMMNRCPEASIAEDGGILGDSLRFAAPTKKVLFYQASPNLSRPRRNWSGTVSIWLKPEVARGGDANDSYPLLFFDGDWRRGGFYLRRPHDSPSTIEFVAVSATTKAKHDSLSLEDVPASHQGVVRIKDAVEAGEWTLVTITFDGVNPAGRDNSNASLYLNGTLAGRLERPIDVAWMSPAVEEVPEAAVFLGVDYVGDMDDLRLYDRDLRLREIQQLFDASERE